jgi:hypothetical protein
MNARRLACVVAGAVMMISQAALSADIDQRVARAITPQARPAAGPDSKSIPLPANVASPRTTLFSVLINPTPLTVISVEFGGSPAPDSRSMSSQLGTEMHAL